MKTRPNLIVNRGAGAGVTLIELMITVAIIGILAAISYPSYTRYMTQSRRSDAHIALTNAAAKQEKFFSDCGYYAKTLSPPPAARVCGADYDGGVLQLAAASPDGHYILSIVAATASSLTFEIVADPEAAGASNRQNNDGRFMVNQQGQKFWDRNDDGDFTDPGETTWK